MYYYYKKEAFENRKINNEFSTMYVKKRHPKAKANGFSSMNIGWKRLIYFHLFSFLIRGFSRKFIEYDLFKNNVIIAKACLISKVPIYSFLPHKGLHLCYCEVIPSERGKGYYTSLLEYISNDKQEEDLYMLVEQDNLPSIKGIEKAGFIRYAYGIKTKKNRFIVSSFL